MEGIHWNTVLCVSRGKVFRLNAQLVVGRWRLTEGCVVVLRGHEDFLAVAWHCRVVLTVLGQSSGEGYDINRGRSALLLAAPPRLPLDLLLSQAVAGPTEGRAEHDGNAEAQHGHEDL